MRSAPGVTSDNLTTNANTLSEACSVEDMKASCYVEHCETMCCEVSLHYPHSGLQQSITHSSLHWRQEVIRLRDGENTTGKSDGWLQRCRFRLFFFCQNAITTHETRILGCPVVDHLTIITRIDNIGKLYGQRLTYLHNLQGGYCMQNYIKPQSRKKYRRNSDFNNSWSTCHPTWRRVRWSISTAHARISREKSFWTIFVSLYFDKIFHHANAMDGMYVNAHKKWPSQKFLVCTSLLFNKNIPQVTTRATRLQ